MVQTKTRARRYARLVLPEGMLVGWQATGKRTVSVLTTLGMGGLFISAQQPAAVGEILKLLIDTPDGEIRALAAVRDSEPGKGMGVEFTGMDSQARSRLQQLVKRLGMRKSEV